MSWNKEVRKRHLSISLLFVVQSSSAHRFGEQSGPLERFVTKTNLFPLWWQGNISHRMDCDKYLGGKRWRL
jgi:hypothetical protein